MSDEDQSVEIFLDRIQLGQFYEVVRDDLHITRIEHFDHVIDSDLQNIGMSMPEVRRLFDHLKRNKKNHFLSKIKKSFKFANENANNRSKPDIVLNQSMVQKEPKPLETRCLIHKKDITFLEIIGKGAFGYVQSAEWRTSSNDKILVAVKCIQATGGNGVQDVQSETVREANAMSTLNHPNLIKFYGILVASPLMLVTEIAPFGTLLKKLKLEPHKFLVSNLASFIIQIAAGMKYLEKNKVVHRDLAARNILLISYEKVKIGDFGLARFLDGSNQHYTMSENGLIPFAWCAPECMKFQRFSHASDVWAFGVTVFEIFTFGVEPWAGLNGAQIYEKIEQPNCEKLPRPDKCPEDIYEILLEHCWKYYDNERSTFEEIEKLILEVLPIEVHALNSTNTTAHDDLAFNAGHIISIFDMKSGKDRWRGQNRMTRKVGFFPSNWVDFCSYTIKAGSDFVDNVGFEEKKQRRNAISLKNRYCDPLWNNYEEISEVKKNIVGNIEPSELDPNSPGEELPYRCNSISSSICVTPSEKESYCEEFLSQNSSIDSGCLSRCSTYSSNSSTEYRDLDLPSSVPINIPGNSTRSRNNNNNNKRSSGSFSSIKRSSLISTNSQPYSVISEPCNLHSKRSSLYSLPSQDSRRSEELPNSMSPEAHSTGSPSGFDRLRKTLSTLKIDTRKTNTPKKQTGGRLGERRQSLPNLVTSRKNDILRKTKRRFKRHVSANENHLPSSPAVGSPVGSKFYVQTQESLVWSPSNIDISNIVPLYDLVPSRNDQDNLLVNQRDSLDPFTRGTNCAENLSDDINSHGYMNPLECNIIRNQILNSEASIPVAPDSCDTTVDKICNVTSETVVGENTVINSLDETANENTQNDTDTNKYMNAIPHAGDDKGHKDNGEEHYLTPMSILNQQSTEESHYKEPSVICRKEYENMSLFVNVECQSNATTALQNNMITNPTSSTVEPKPALFQAQSIEEFDGKEKVSSDQVLQSELITVDSRPKSSKTEPIDTSVYNFDLTLGLNPSSKSNVVSNSESESDILSIPNSTSAIDVIPVAPPRRKRADSSKRVSKIIEFGSDGFSIFE